MTSFHTRGAARAKHTPVLLLALAALALPFGSAQGQSTPGDWIEVRGGAWSVDTGTYVDMASRVQKAADTAPKAEAKSVPLDSYTMQYQGQMQGSTKVIHVMGVCKVEEAMARKMTSQWNVAAASGGTCYFEADYNPASKSFTKFSFNAK